ncbi:MAG: hypothetical protein K0U74_05735 [Alphaproteobacteria bacterium]|nr:hypothetical protein [Alphaproteobacteria bacterium]
MLEHPRPTDATIKYLYAHAFRCGFKDCPRPLYRLDEFTGVRTLNSRVCHIHARREGGPRWDPQQSESDNRSETNLILMCVEHAAAIDDSLTRRSYPATTLREWKARQLADFDKIQQGWILDDQMTTDAAEASFSQVEIAVNNSTISLGGKGGAAPGAGGGGGGAIGRNASGGHGGDGGGKRIVDGEFTVPFADADASVVLNDGLSDPIVCPDGRAPGSGGGGAGASGDNLRGGDGGGGGELVRGVFDLVALRTAGFDRIEVEIGKGGVGASMPGQHGISGDDTVLRFLKHDGTVLRTVRAKGGIGAASAGSTLPEGTVELSLTDINDGFRIQSLMAVNGAENRDGLLYVLGGDWTNLKFPMLPTDAQFTVVVSARWRTLNGQSSRGIFLTLTNPLGQEVSCANLIIPSDGLHTCHGQWIHPIGAKFDVEGLWTVTIRSGQFMLATTDIHVSASDV